MPGKIMGNRADAKHRNRLVFQRHTGLNGSGFRRKQCVIMLYGAIKKCQQTLADMGGKPEWRLVKTPVIAEV